MQMFQTRLRLGAALLAAAACLPVSAQTTVLAPSVPLAPGNADPATAAPSTASTASPVLRIARFNAQPQGAVAPGSTVRFTLDGTPGATASVSMPGPDIAVPLREVQPGHYEGSHVLRAQDLSMPSPVVAHLQLGSRQASAQLATQFAASSQAAGTTALGGAPAMAPLTLQVTTPGNNTMLDGSPAIIRGRTAPNATVHARIDAVPPANPGRTGVAQPLTEQTVQADAEGNFNFSFGPQPMPPGTRFEVELRATQGAQASPGLRLVLFPRQG
ncbi:MAG: hypothetical protein ACXWJJ_14645 [Ramlibacter sp.]